MLHFSKKSLWSSSTGLPSISQNSPNSSVVQKGWDRPVKQPSNLRWATSPSFNNSKNRLVGFELGSEFRVARWVGGYIHYPISVGTFSRSFLNVEQLDIKAFYFSFSISRPHEQMVDSTQWLELFRSFPGVEALGVSGVLVRNIGSALERVATGEAAKDMLPALYDLRFNGTRGYMSEIIESFVAARQPSESRLRAPHPQRGLAWLSERGWLDIWLFSRDSV
jgi:hypothetical protein